MLKVIFLVLLFSVLIFGQNLRKIEILPSKFSKTDFQSKVIEVTQEYVEKYLVGQREFTFVDVTDQQEILSVPKTNEPYPEPRRQSIVKPILENANVNSTRGFLSKLTSFPTRRSSVPSSQNSVLMIKKEIESIIDALPQDRKSRFKVDLIVIRGYAANSITVTFEGSGSDKDVNVLFGAHSDDVGHPNAGADDNGSGSTCVFESFRIVAQSNYNPSKSIVWLFYTAEESGLVGSTQIARDWKSRNMKVYGHLNYDMVGNHPQGQPLAGRRLTINTTKKITEYIFELSKLYTKLDINQWAFNGGSDHIPWTRNGFESACVSERHFSPHYHTSRDKIENVNFDIIVEFSRLAASYLIELS